ncbi:MAG: calcium-binding protein, partial [Rhizobiaceae bacterium]
STSRIADRQMSVSLSGNQLAVTFVAAALTAEFVASIDIDLSAHAGTFDPSVTSVTVGAGEDTIDAVVSASPDEQVLHLEFADGEVSEGDVLTIDFSVSENASDIEAESVVFSTTFSDGTTSTAEISADEDAAAIVTNVVAGQVVDGTAINDTLVGGDGDDTLTGGAGNDVITGGAGSDTISGGGGDDILAGGLGADTLWGGSGADTFVIDDTTAADIIRDFEGGLVGDVIDLSEILELAAGTDVEAGGFVHYDDTTGDLSVDQSGNADTGDGDVVATVENSGSAVTNETIRILFSDGAGGTDTDVV